MSSSTPVDMEISDGSDTNSDMDVSDSDQEVVQIVAYPSSSTTVPFANQPAMASASYVASSTEFDPRSYHTYSDQGSIPKQTPISSFYPGHDAAATPAMGITPYDYNSGYGVQTPYMDLPHHTIHFNPHVAPQSALGGFSNAYEPVGEILAGDSSMNLSDTALAEDTLSESGYYTAPGSPTNDTEDEEPGLIKSDDDELEGLKAQLEYYQQQIDGFDKEIEDITKDKRRLEHEFLRLRVQQSMVQNRRKAKGSVEAPSIMKKGPSPSESPVSNPANHPQSRPSNHEQTNQISALSLARTPASEPSSVPSPSQSPVTIDSKHTPVAKLSPSPLLKISTPPSQPQKSYVWTNPRIGKKDPPTAEAAAIVPSSSASKASTASPDIQKLAGAASPGPPASISNKSGLQTAKRMIAPNIRPIKNQPQPKQQTKYHDNQIQRTGLETSHPAYSAGAPPPRSSSKPTKTAIASEKNAFRPYDSPLRRLGITKGRSNNQQQQLAILNENLTREICQFEIAGTCNDDTCTALHFRDFEGTMSR